MLMLLTLGKGTTLFKRNMVYLHKTDQFLEVLEIVLVSVKQMARI